MTMKAGMSRVLKVLLGAVFVVSCALLLKQTLQYQQGENIYDEAVALAQLPEWTDAAPTVEEVTEELRQEKEVSAEAVTEPLPEESGQESEEVSPPEDPYADALRDMDFTRLREVNGDVLGWILIPDTNVSYPMVQGKNNDYYLRRTWDKTRNTMGSIFVDYRNGRDLRDFHTVIYGHRMRDGSMFGRLYKYEDADYWKDHPDFYLADDSGSHTYTIFSAYLADSMDTYQFEFADDGEKEDFIQYCVSKSWLDTGIVPGVNDRIVTLSTCSGNGYDTRWVIHGVRTE